MDNKTQFIKYCQSGESDKVILMMQDENIYKEMTELYTPPGGPKNINRLFLGIGQCIIYKHYDMAMTLMINYNVDIKMDRNSYLYWWLDSDCNDIKMLDIIFGLYDKIMPNYDKLFRMLCDNHKYHNVELLLKKYNYKIDIYTEKEGSFIVACVNSDMEIVMFLINTSRKKPYRKMFNIYRLETIPAFDMYNYEQLFIYMASCGTYKHYDKKNKFII